MSGPGNMSISPGTITALVNDDQIASVRSGQAVAKNSFLSALHRSLPRVLFPDRGYQPRFCPVIRLEIQVNMLRLAATSSVRQAVAGPAAGIIRPP
jgi:hypothetical protein